MFFGEKSNLKKVSRRQNHEKLHNMQKVKHMHSVPKFQELDDFFYISATVPGYILVYNNSCYKWNDGSYKWLEAQVIL